MTHRSYSLRRVLVRQVPTFVVALTNRRELIDPAVLRPGSARGSGRVPPPALLTARPDRRVVGRRAVGRRHDGVDALRLLWGAARGRARGLVVLRPVRPVWISQGACARVDVRQCVRARARVLPAPCTPRHARRANGRRRRRFGTAPSGCSHSPTGSPTRPSSRTARTRRTSSSRYAAVDALGTFACVDAALIRVPCSMR